MYMAIEGLSTRPIVLSMIPDQSYCRRRMCFTIFVPEEMKVFQPLTLLIFINKTTFKDQVGDSFVTYSWKGITPNFDKSLE